MKEKSYLCNLMECFKLTYHNFKPTLKVVYKKPSFKQNIAQRFLSIDPLAEYFGQVVKSPYSFASNNPISFNDPSGLCDDCPDPDNYSDQEEYRVNGETYVIQGGEWVRDGGNLDEVVIDRLSQKGVMNEEMDSGLESANEQDEWNFEFLRRSEGFKNFDKTFNKGLGVISVVPTPIVVRATIDGRDLKRKIKKAKAKGRVNQTATKKLGKLKASMKGLDKFSKKLGYVGVAYNGVTLTTDILVGEEITASRLFDTGIGILFSVIAISNPVGLVLLAAYTIGDSLGAFDGIKESLGGNTVIINGN